MLEAFEETFSSFTIPVGEYSYFSVTGSINTSSFQGRPWGTSSDEVQLRITKTSTELACLQYEVCVNGSLQQTFEACDEDNGFSSASNFANTTGIRHYLSLDLQGELDDPTSFALEFRYTDDAGPWIFRSNIEATTATNSYSYDGVFGPSQVDGYGCCGEIEFPSGQARAVFDSTDMQHNFIVEDYAISLEAARAYYVSDVTVEPLCVLEDYVAPPTIGSQWDCSVPGSTPTLDLAEIQNAAMEPCRELFVGEGAGKPCIGPGFE